MNRFPALLLCLLLAACGFHPKGTLTALPPHSWQLENAGSLHTALSSALHRAGASAGGNSAYSLHILAADSKKDIYTITRAAKLNEYLLSLRVSAQARRHGENWGSVMTVTVERTLPYADGMVLGKQEEEALIWQEMQQDAADQLIRRLAFLPE